MLGKSLERFRTAPHGIGMPEAQIREELVLRLPLFPEGDETGTDPLPIDIGARVLDQPVEAGQHIETKRSDSGERLRIWY